MNLTLTTPPDQAEVLNILSLADMKINLRVGYTKEDGYITDCIRAAYTYLDGADGWLNRAILTQTWTIKLPGFVRPIPRFEKDRDGRPCYSFVPTRVIELPFPPLQSVTSVKYLVDGVLQTLSASDYSVVTGTLFGSIQLKNALQWPTGLDVHPEAVEIKFVAGYGVGADVITKAFNIREAMKLLGGDRFRNREDTYAEMRLVAVDRKIINGVQRLAGRYKVPNHYA